MKKLTSLIILSLLMIIGCSKAPPGMVYVEGGSFQMGSKKSKDEKPIHTVTVSSFFMDKTEVTQARIPKSNG